MLLGKAVFAAGGAVAGVNLARQARREKGFPVHQWASAIIFVGGIGLIGFGLAPALADSRPQLAGALMVVGDGLERIALLGLALFVWRVFGAGKATRRAVLVAIAGLVLADWIHLLAIQRWPEPIGRPVRDALSQLVFALPIAWSSLEAGLEHAKARRQLRLGLTTRTAVARFALWTWGCAALASVCVLAAVAAISPPGGAVAAATEYLRAVLYAGIAGVIWLGFHPPAFFRRRLARPAGDPS
jgi:hypothetical protein